MHPESLFLRQFIAIARQIAVEPGEQINRLAILLSEYSLFLDDSSETVGMIDALSAAIENAFQDAYLQQLHAALFIFWQKMFMQKKPDIFFFGSEEHANYLFTYLDRQQVGNLFYISVQPGDEIARAAYQQPLSLSARPVVIYDHGADALTGLEEMQQVVALVDFQQWMMLKALPFSATQDLFISQLQFKHNQLIGKNSPTLILGNSYGYYAFPQNCLRKAVNLSMHSSDLRQAQRMMTHYIAANKKVKTLVMMFGYFDLYYELSKTRTADNIRVVHIMSHYNRRNSLIAPSELSQRGLGCPDEALMADLLPVQASSEALTDLAAVLDNEAQLKMVGDRLEMQLNETASLPEEQFASTSISRAGLHSKSIKYQESKRVNMRILSQMCALAVEKGIRLHYVIPPFPPAYLQAMAPEMISETRRFLKSLQCYHFTLHDFNDAGGFSRTDFRDGDHLNWHGAVKLTSALKKRGLTL